MRYSQACRVVWYGTRTVCTVQTALAKIRRTTVIVTPFIEITVEYGTVYGTVPCWHWQCKNGLRMPLHPKTSHFRSTVCSSHVLMPHIASLNDPETGLGLHQLGGRAQQRLAWKPKGRRCTPFLALHSRMKNSAGIMTRH